MLLVTRWVHHNPSSRERNLRSLLTWVQWCRLNPQTAIKLMQTHPLYSNSNSLLALFFLLDALNDNQLLPSDFLAPFYKLKAKFCQVRGFVLCFCLMFYPVVLLVMQLFLIIHYCFFKICTHKLFCNKNECKRN